MSLLGKESQRLITSAMLTSIIILHYLVSTVTCTQAELSTTPVSHSNHSYIDQLNDTFNITYTGKDRQLENTLTDQYHTGDDAASSESHLSTREPEFSTQIDFRKFRSGQFNKTHVSYKNRVISIPASSASDSEQDMTMADIRGRNINAFSSSLPNIPFWNVSSNDTRFGLLSYKNTERLIPLLVNESSATSSKVPEVFNVKDISTFPPHRIHAHDHYQTMKNVKNVVKVVQEDTRRRQPRLEMLNSTFNDGELKAASSISTTRADNPLSIGATIYTSNEENITEEKELTSSSGLSETESSTAHTSNNYSTILLSISMTESTLPPEPKQMIQTVSSSVQDQVVPKEVRIAWLAPLGWKEGFSAQTTVNVLKQAISDSQRFLPHTSIRVKWYDTKCTHKAALAAAVDARRDFDPDLFLGPPCSPGMTGVAMLASHWNLPVFGWVSNDHALEDRSIYSTLVRVLGPLNQFSYTMHFVTILFRWRRFAMIYDVDDAYRSVNDAITVYLKEKNNTITSQHSVDPNMPDSEIQEILQQVRKYARVLVFSVPWMTMRKYMLVAHRLGMTEGDFSFICINGDVYTNTTLYSEVLSDAGWRRNDSHDAEARIAFESVIHVIMATSNLDVFATFTEYVAKAGMLQSPLWELPPADKTMDAYAPFVYDATVLWALLVNSTLQEGGDPRNGTNIFRLARGIQSLGVTGTLVLDHNCDRLSNVWFLDMQPDGKFVDFVQIENTLRGGFLKALQTKLENVRVLWRDGTSGSKHAPPDTPPCGFEGEYCKQSSYHPPQDYTDSIVGAAAGSSFVFIVAVLVQVKLRRYRRHRQLESMLWQVKFEEIDFVTAILSGSVRASFRNLARRRNHSNKKSRIESINFDENSSRSQHLFDADAVMFGSVAYVRGSLVSVKRISRTNISLTKELLQELNKLMELKHQNITAFVGACVDPGRILLLWEYCPKGSLQDIILNQNINLDQLFKFALCQDVAKGLEYIHKSSVNYHSNLKSSNCVVDSRWTCKLTDFGVPRLRIAEKASIQSTEHSDGFWTAPEILRGDMGVDFQKADIFALGIIFKEVFTRSAPYFDCGFMSSIEILRRVMRPESNSVPFRPPMSSDIRSNHELNQLINDCWADDPGVRPSATRVLKVLSKINPSKNMGPAGAQVK